MFTLKGLDTARRWKCKAH